MILSSTITSQRCHQSSPVHTTSSWLIHCSTHGNLVGSTLSSIVKTVTWLGVSSLFRQTLYILCLYFSVSEVFPLMFSRKRHRIILDIVSRLFSLLVFCLFSRAVHACRRSIMPATVTKRAWLEKPTVTLFSHLRSYF